MKKLFSTLVLALACICSAWAQMHFVQTYEVSTPQELIDALKDPYAVIYLTGDIDFRGYDYKINNSTQSFSGVMDGNGYSIKNISLNHTKKNGSGEALYHGLVNYAENAEFRNIIFDGCQFKMYGYFGCMVGSSKNCVYDNIHLKNSMLSTESDCLGGLFGFTTNDSISNCSTDASCKLMVSDHDSKTIGGIAARAKNTAFVNCRNAAEVTICGNRIGGIAGEAEDCTFERCVNDGHVYHTKSWLLKDNSRIGGIAGFANKSYFTMCTNNGTLYCEKTYGGGIVGYVTRSTISNCLNATSRLEEFDSTKANGGIAGYAFDSKVTNNLSVCDIRLVGEESCLDPISGNNYRFVRDRRDLCDCEMGVTTQQIESGIVAYWLNRWDGNDVKPWRMADGPTLNPEANEVNIKTLNASVILSAQDLVAFAESVNSGNTGAVGILGADIDLQGIDFKPIGTNSNRFRGIFDGRGHTISNLNVNVTSSQGAGLFGTISAGADICDVIIAKGSTVTNTTDAGAAGIVGLIDNGWYWGQVNIERCGSFANVNVTKHGGGILGRIITNTGKDPNVKVFIDKCYSMGTIKASQGYSGMFAGYTKNHAIISNSWTYGDLKRMEAGNPAPYDEHDGYTEHFAGYDSNISLKNCYHPSLDKKTQKDVNRVYSSDVKGGWLTYQLNGGAYEGSDVVWYQKIGTDACPKLVSTGGDIVYAMYEPTGKTDRLGHQVLEDCFTNDESMNGLINFGSLRVEKDGKNAYLDGNSDLEYRVYEWGTVHYRLDTLFLVRDFKKNVPTTVYLPSSIAWQHMPATNARFFTFAEMKYDEENDSYQAVMEEWPERSDLASFHAFLMLPNEDMDRIPLLGGSPAPPIFQTVTTKGDWSFVGVIRRPMRLTEKEEEEGAYYGFAGQEVDGFKLGEFVRLGAGATIPPFRAYLKKNTPGKGPERIDVTTRAITRAAQRTTDDEDPDDIFGDDDEETIPDMIEVLLKALNGETGIAKLDTKTGEFTFEGWYDLNGNRVDEDYQGIRVKGDKKVIVK